jgi:thioredoxin reductase (NADPH)
MSPYTAKVSRNNIFCLEVFLLQSYGMNDHYELIIIGAGPSGIACAIEAEKAGLSYIVLEKGFLANSIYNFPTNMTFFSTSERLEIGKVPFISHTEKPTRKEALEYYRRIVESYGLKIRYQTEINTLEKSADLCFHLKTTKGKVFKADYVIAATGYYDVPRLLHVEGEDLPKVKHYYDDAHPYIGMKVLVVGAANSACDVALETWQKGANVSMAVRSSELYQKVKYWILPNIENRINEGSIKAYFNSEVKKISPDTVTIETPDGTIEIENDYVLAMTGYKPDYNFLAKLGVQFDGSEAQRPLFNESTLESNVEGLYLAGVILAGLNTSKLFIENTRDHGKKIIEHIRYKTRANA